MQYTITPDRLLVVKQQAHALRDKLLSLVLIEVPGKAAWLNLVAGSLGYADWGELQAKARHAHRDAESTPLITPDTLEPIARHLHLELAHGDLGVDTLEALLAEVATAEERQGLADAGIALPTIVPPEVITLELGPSDPYAHDLLLWWYPATMPRREQDVEASYIRHKKIERQGLSRAEAKARRLDLYPNSGVRVGRLLDTLLSEQYLEQDADERYVISERGIEWCAGTLTDDYGEVWQAWFGEVRRLWAAQIHHRPFPHDWSYMIAAYARGRTPQAEVALRDWGDYERNIGTQLTEHIARHLEVSADQLEAMRVLAITPRLKLEPWQRPRLSEITVEVEVEGLMAPQRLPARRYWPKPIHIGAGNDAAVQGLFLALPAGQEAVVATITWTLPGRQGEPMTVTHTHHYHLGPRRSGWLYHVAPSGVDAPERHEPIAYASGYWWKQAVDGELTEASIKALPRVREQIEYLDIKPGAVAITEHLHVEGHHPNSGYHLRRVK